MTDATKDPEEFTESLPRITPAEAGFSANFHLTHDKTGPIQFTFRGATSDEWHIVMKDVSEFTQHMKALGYRFNVPQPAPPPAPNKAAEIVAEEGNHEAAQVIAANAERVPDPPQGKQWLVLESARTVIIPQPDGRIKIEFYALGHEYADLRTTWKPEQVAGLLKHVTSIDVNKPADLALPCKVYYTLGKEYKNAKTGATGNYKDIGHCRPA